MSIGHTHFNETQANLENAQIAPFITINHIAQAISDGMGSYRDQPGLSIRFWAQNIEPMPLVQLVQDFHRPKLGNARQENRSPLRRRKN